MARKTMGEKLREARLAAGLSQDKVAAITGVFQSIIQRYETGAVKTPKKNTLLN
jgi:transcriptional regulator with XRE-family HTH domain